MKPNVKIIRLVVVVVAVLLVGYWAVTRWAGSRQSILKISGNIELTQVDIAFKVPGRLIERAVDEGQSVKKGMLIARLDPEQTKRQRDREQAGLLSAEAQLQQTVTAAAYQKESHAADVQLRRAELAQAQARLAELTAGSRRQEIEEARAAVDQATTEEQRASRDWQRAETLQKTDDISASQYDQFQRNYRAAAAVARQARERLNLVAEGPRQEQIAQARAQVERAQAAVRLSEAARLEVQRREEEVQTRRAERERARAQVQVMESQLNDTQAYAPVDGTVLTKAAEVGQILAAGTTVVTLGDLEHPWVRGYINEKDLGRIKLGAKAKVTTDSFPGKVYWGQVTFIASEAEYTPKQIQTQEERVKLVYRIKIEIPNPNHELKSNMPVDAEIVLP